MYHSAEKVKNLLDSYPQYKDKLFCRGFLITDCNNIDLKYFPFYGNWVSNEIAIDGNRVSILTHRLTKCYIYHSDNSVHFLIGHAYNPYTMQYEEDKILSYLSDALENSVEDYWAKVSDLTGVFCIGYLNSKEIIFSTDCTGMQLVYYGSDGKNMFITSHSKLVADLRNFAQDDYVKRLVSSRFYHFWGTWLPGDLSPYKELKRVQPNFAFSYCFGNGDFSFERYYPTEKIVEISGEQYNDTISQIASVLENSMKLIAKKWPNKRAAISVTGGRDSTMTLAAANGTYDDFCYFSYISNENEKPDAEAAHKICDYLGLEHKIYKIPDNDKLYDELEAAKVIFECNAGCIGTNNLNDVKNRLYFDKVDDFDVEVKSWVSELARGEAQNKYNLRKFPAKPTPSWYRCMWKVVLSPGLIKESDRIFKEYLDKFYDEKVLSILPWTDLFYWEFSWSGGEGVFLTSEHKYSYDITIPCNNRKLLNTMFSIPLEDRIANKVPIDVIHLKNRKIEEANVFVKNAAHTSFWEFGIRTYLKVFSKIK